MRFAFCQNAMIESVILIRGYRTILEARPML